MSVVVVSLFNPVVSIILVYFQNLNPFNPGAGSAEFPSCFILVVLVVFFGGFSSLVRDG